MKDFEFSGFEGVSVCFCRCSFIGGDFQIVSMQFQSGRSSMEVLIKSHVP